jgi:hypothetical protein
MVSHWTFGAFRLAKCDVCGRKPLIREDAMILRARAHALTAAVCRLEPHSLRSAVGAGGVSGFIAQPRHRVVLKPRDMSDIRSLIGVQSSAEYVE